MSTDLRTRFETFRAENPKTRIRGAATEMGVSEAELVATGIDGEATMLAAPEGGWREILHRIEPLGEVMALTRNDACVHEKKGTYENVDTDLPHSMCQVIGEPIDLRLFCGRWRVGFAVETPWDGSKDGIRRSLQFFDAHGDAVHKIYLTRKSNVEAYNAFVRAHTATDLDWSAEPRPEPKPETPDEEIDSETFLADWGALQDTHDFFYLLHKHGVSRSQSLRLAEGRFTERIEPISLRRTLEGAAETETPIMIFVGNPGAFQIHTGTVRKLVEHGPWFNVLDPGFNLHLDEKQIAEAWVVVKPTEDGDVTAVEAYDASGDTIVQIFGKRKPGLTELTEWREIVSSLPRQGVAA
ncbi:MAG: ChuX/HutX family heme-like substrate-binding protein [Bacteroidota bacterium]